MSLFFPFLSFSPLTLFLRLFSYRPDFLLNTLSLIFPLTLSHHLLSHLTHTLLQRTLYWHLSPSLLSLHLPQFFLHTFPTLVFLTISHLSRISALSASTLPYIISLTFLLLILSFFSLSLSPSIFLLFPFNHFNHTVTHIPSYAPSRPSAAFIIVYYSISTS